MKILVADDEQYERNAIARLLTQTFGSSVEVRTAENGRRAVEIASLWRCGLAFLDIEMPGMNGLEAAKRIREQNPACWIVFLTAYSEFSYAQEALRLGAQDYLLKPAEDEELIEVVNRFRNVDTEKPQISADPQTSADQQDMETTRVEQVMRFVKGYLKENYMNEISMNQLAEQVGFSPFYFSRLFKQQFQMGFVDYLTDLRISAAKKLLDDPTLPLKNIAARCGYDTPSYFAKIFKKRTGLTPTEYRQRNEANFGRER